MANRVMTVYKEIEDALLEMGIDEIVRYARDFAAEPDFNIVQMGCLLAYYSNVRDMYMEHGAEHVAEMSDDELWQYYRWNVGYIAKILLIINGRI